MKIYNLRKNKNIYSSNAYFILGDWKGLTDKSTMIDTGADPQIIEELSKMPKGAGKKHLEQIIFTHNHFDHIMNLSKIKELYNPEVLGYTVFAGVDRTLSNNEIIRIGDRDFKIIYAPIHSNDSILIYSEKEGVIFTGDFQFSIISPQGSYSPAMLKIIEDMISMDLKEIYPGHGEPVRENIQKILKITKENIKSGKIAYD